MSAALRQRRHRERVAAGKAVITAALPEDDLVFALVTGGLLRPDQADDRQAIAEALAEQCRLWSWLARVHPRTVQILSLLAAGED